MEQNLNETFDSELNYFHLEYKDQNIKENNLFKEWYKKADNYVKEVNKKHEKLPKTSIFRRGTKFLTISFCNNCNCYVICSITTSFSSIRCMKCRKYFCPGCFKFNSIEGTICLKGYFKLLYLRTINGRCCLEESKIIINIIFIFFFLIFTPFYIGFTSSHIGLFPHPKKLKNNENENEKDDNCKTAYIILYSFLKGLLMTHYVITFLPFLFIVLLPGIFSKKYFYRIMVMYLSIGIPGTSYLKNLGE